MKPTKKELRRAEYIVALGRFVDSYSMTETYVHLCFRRFAKLTHEMAMAIKGSMRLSDLIPLTKRVMLVKKWSADDRKEIADALDHLNVISEFRDRVLHRGADFEQGGTLLSTNVATSKSIDLIEFFSFNIGDIENAIEDLAQIRARISLVVFRSGLTKRFSQEAISAARQPWRYKSVKRETIRQRSLRAQKTRAPRR